jgi:MFS family permease
MGKAEMTREQLDGPAVTQKALFGLVVVFFLYFTFSFAVQTLPVARPMMAAELDGLKLFSWSISIPALGGAFVTLVFGKFSDMYGRRRMLLIALSIFLLGSVLSALSPTYVFLIAANTIQRLGQGSLAPLCFALLGDMYSGAERSKWAGLLRIPAGIFALAGPTLGGWLADNLSWRYVFWITVPVVVIALIMVPFGVPPPVKKKEALKMDIRGVLLLMVASSSLILGFSFAGTTYPWSSVQVMTLLAVSLVFWFFFIREEYRAEHPILDPKVLTNRTFFTAAGAGVLSFFGLTGMLNFFPLFLQGVQGVSATLSGQVITPFTVLMAFMGVPTGLLLARTKRYKWMFLTGYSTLTLVLFGMVFFRADSPLWWGFLAATVGGLGLGSIPTINTLVVQYAVPKRFLGAATGAIFFSVSMGLAISPAILGSAMNMRYNRTLEALLPTEINQVADESTAAALSDPRMLLMTSDMEKLRGILDRTGSRGAEIFAATVAALRSSMESGLRVVFFIGAVCMLLAFLLILTIPEVSIEEEVPDE